MKNDDNELIKVISPFGPSIARVKIPNELVENLNNYIDKIILDENKTKDLNHGVKLAGHVTQEFKLENDFIVSSGFQNFLASSVTNWMKLSENKDLKEFKLISSWVVRQFENEYNPVHWHGGHVSGVGYLKVPKFISKKIKKTKVDGTIDFINGNKMFLSDSIHNHQPKVGDVILFPNYLMHTAYPFKSSGERRSFSFNLKIDDKIANVFSR